MTTVHLICGKLGAGKTTLAKRLEHKRRAVRLSLDEWMLHSYEEPMSREVFDRRVALCIDLMLRLTERLIELGTEVVLDVGFWKRSHRDLAREVIARAGGVPVLYLLEDPPDTRWQRLSERNRHLVPGTYPITAGMFAELEPLFEPLGDDELRGVVRSNVGESA